MNGRPPSLASGPPSARPVHLFGVLGAVLLTVGLVVAGVGYIILSNAATNLEACLYAPSRSESCPQAENAYDNATATDTLLLGTGMLVAGAGAALGFGAMIAIFARRDRALSTGTVATPSAFQMPPSGPTPSGSPPPPSAGPPADPSSDTFSYPPPPPGPP